MTGFGGQTGSGMQTGWHGWQTGSGMHGISHVCWVSHGLQLLYKLVFLNFRIWEKKLVSCLFGSINEFLGQSKVGLGNFRGERSILVFQVIFGSKRSILVIFWSKNLISDYKT